MGSVIEDIFGWVVADGCGWFVVLVVTSVKKVFLVNATAVKMTCFYTDQHFFLKNNLRQISLVLNFFG